MKIQPADFKTGACICGARLCEPQHVSLQTKPLRVTDPRSSFECRSPGLAQTRGENAMITLIFIALLAIMMVLVMVESSSLVRLHREVKLLEHQQTKRLNGPQTNTVSTVTVP